MAVGFSNTNKPLNPRGNDQSPLGFNRLKLYSGKALDFDGVNDEVDLGTQSFITESGFSISTYLNLDDNSEHYIFSTGYSNADSLLFYSAASSTTFGVSWYDGSSATLSTAVDYTIGEWFHALITYDGTTLKIYKNGVEVVSEAFAIDNIASGVYEIGWASPRAKSTAYLQGKVGGFKTFNTALTAAQVADLYNNPEKVVPTGVDNTALKLWLPMQEGAGTTAYDGSGNGNHGTISGATYTHGIGAPVSQTAVMNWNKGTNIINKSESFLSSYYSNQNITVTADQITAPDGDNNGYKFVASNANTFHLSNHSAAVSAGVYTQSIFAKAGEYEHIYLVLRTDGGAKRYGVKFDLSDGTFVDDENYGSATNTGYAISDAGNGWYRCSVTSNHSSGNIIAVFGPSLGGNVGDINNEFQGDGTSGIYAWGLQAEIATSVGAYIPNPSDTRITSPVLLPQGLTTGRDITGVNLFENVRKQGALNLDGKSWAEVHDNASLDVTSAITLEAWVYSSASDPTAGEGIISKWHESSGNRSYMIYALDYDTFYFFLSNDGTATNNISWSLDGGELEQYNHFVCTFDGSSFKAYKNGSLATTGTTTFSTLKQSDKNVAISNFNVGQGQQRKYSNSIAQPRIYNRALTAAEVLQNYNSGKNTYK